MQSSQVKAFYDQLENCQKICRTITQEKERFLSFMEKESLDEVRVSYMDMKNNDEQLELSFYKERVTDLEKKFRDLRHVGEMLMKKLDQKPIEFELPPHNLQKAEIQSLLLQKLKEGDEW